MSRTGRSTVTLERLKQLLDAYGGAAECWPEEEREPALWLIEQSAAARALRDEAAALDVLLDAVPSELPSALLAARVLGAAPRARRVRFRRVALVALPLAAAAAVALWLAIDHQPTRELAKAPAIAVGEYTSPTDVLLGYGVADVYTTVPSIGCPDSDLGCPSVKPDGTSWLHREPLRGNA